MSIQFVLKICQFCNFSSHIASSLLEQWNVINVELCKNIVQWASWSTEDIFHLRWTVWNKCMCLIDRNFSNFDKIINHTLSRYRIISNLHLIPSRKLQPVYQEELNIAHTNSLAMRKSSITKKVSTFILDGNCCNVPFSYMAQEKVSRV